MTDEEIKAQLLFFFEAIGMPVGEVELRKNASGELEGILLIRPDGEASQEEN